MKYIKLLLGTILFAFAAVQVWGQQQKVSLSLIPPTMITNKVNLDIRAGIVNNESKKQTWKVSLYLNKVDETALLYRKAVSLQPSQSECVRFVMPTQDKIGENEIILVASNDADSYRTSKKIRIIKSDIRSTRLIDGAWTGLYHWSEEEGKHWNQDIKKMTDANWKEMMRSMHSVGMDIVVIQEVFRNQAYVDKHSLTMENFPGAAFYPSKLYPSRVPITAHDPLEAILSEADKLDMHVFMGVGLFAWFDFSEMSLTWHKAVAKELWDMYGHHPSFYGFYVSEESAGSLYNGAATDAEKAVHKTAIVDFFKEFTAYCRQLAPSKPVMLATNSMGVPEGLDTYPELLKHLDILCPFGFARMPEGDLTGKEAADMLQQLCDDAQSHLWFDLEAFLFNEDTSLYPRPFNEIIRDLTLLDNFEKILCYQFPGVFNDPAMSVRIGEKRTFQLFRDYRKYYKKTHPYPLK